jgi:ABC-2 type transport system permease protein
VRERERGNLELLITTPASSLELMLGKLVPYVFIGLIQTTLVLLLGVLLFHVPINGNLFAFYFAALLFIAATLTLGLIASTVAETQMQAFQMSVFVLLPSILLSGFIFPFDGMPQVAGGSPSLPLSTSQLVRGIVLRGAGLAGCRFRSTSCSLYGCRSRRTLFPQAARLTPRTKLRALSPRSR